MKIKVLYIKNEDLNKDPESLTKLFEKNSSFFLNASNFQIQKYEQYTYFILMFGNNVNLVCTDDDTPPHTSSSVSDLIRRQRKQKEDTIKEIETRAREVEQKTLNDAQVRQVYINKKLKELEEQLNTGWKQSPRYF